jgi:site-specific DNA-methyltransferase (adenine-specific)
MEKKVIKSDSKKFLSTFKEYEFDIIFADPPYALGSKVIIRKDGRVDYAKASDFMNKWEMPTGEYWEKWFIEAYRTLKHGGWLIMYGMDRQTLLFKYYALLAGFDEQQSLYWYFISNFPKATDLSKMIDKNAGVEREVVGKSDLSMPNIRGDGSKMNVSTSGETTNREDNLITAPKTELAKKYDGYKYSVAPLKQTCETIMVFKKPNKTGSVLHDTLAMEQGDNTISVSALNIDDNRVEANDDLAKNCNRKSSVSMIKDDKITYGKYNVVDLNEYAPTGRYPAQSFVDEQVASRLDLQSGISGGGEPKQNSEISRKGIKDNAPAFNSSNSGIDVNKGQGLGNYGDIGGCSKILHKIKYELYDHDLFIYEPKVGEAERNNGLGGFEAKQYSHDGRDKPTESPHQRNDSVAKNNHPTLKPIDLNAKILTLFKTPNEQKICYPFAGSGSEILGGLKANLQNWFACEINEDYVEIANARIKHYTTNEFLPTSLFGDD